MNRSTALVLGSPARDISNACEETEESTEMTANENRYARQQVLPEIGKEGQERLAGSTVLILGYGALGCVHGELLARTGVGRIRLVDRDLVELTNLHRQIAFDENDALSLTPKVEAAERRLRAINSTIAIEAHALDVTPRNLEPLLDSVDVVLDATDNFETRYLLNDASVKLEKPWIYGGVIGTEGVTMPILPGKGPCLRCLIPAAPMPGSVPTCDTSGVLNAAVAVIASWQVTAALRLLVGSPPPEVRLTALDPWNGACNSFKVDRAAACPCCWQGKFEFLDAKRTTWTTVLCGRNAVQVTPPQAVTLDARALTERLGRVGRVTRGGLLLRFQTGDVEMAIFPDGRAIIMGTTDEAKARTLYAKYLGT